MIYKFLDYFFFGFHAILILFNSFGWIVKRTRKWNLILLSVTAFSWFVLGIWYGWGYCFCTDWHWIVRRQLGYDDMSESYIHFFILKLTGINFSGRLVNTVTVIVFFTSFVLSILLNVIDYKRTRKDSPDHR